MLDWIKHFFLPPAPTGHPTLLRASRADDPPLHEGATPSGHGEWRITSHGAETISLYAVTPPPLGLCRLSFRAELRSRNLTHCAYLELSCRLSGQPPLLARGLHHALHGDQEWEYQEISLCLRKGQSPDLIRLNIATEGAGTIWFRNLKLLATSLR